MLDSSLMDGKPVLVHPLHNTATLGEWRVPHSERIEWMSHFRIIQVVSSRERLQASPETKS